MNQAFYLTKKKKKTHHINPNMTGSDPNEKIQINQT